MAEDSVELGRRIAIARQEAGQTQDELASTAQLDRSALAKIETGKRKVTALELARIAAALDSRVEWLLEEPPPAVVSRRNAAEPGAPSPAIDRLAERIAREVEFLEGLNAGLELLTPAEVAAPTSNDEAEALARDARHLLGYDDSEPAENLARHVARVGLLAFSLELGDEAADGASILLQRGGIAVVNGSRQIGRRRLTLAHELAHYLCADEYSVDWRVADESAGRRESRLDRFARALLLPSDAVERIWRVHSEEGRDTRTAAVLTASEFRVDMATLSKRLQELRLATSGEISHVRTARTTRADIVDFALVIPQELSPPELPPLYEQAVLASYRAERISAARALDLLLNTWQEDDLPELSPLPEEAIWKFVS